MPKDKLDEIIQRILQIIIPDKIILFGSRARGNAREDSDYDILVIKSDIVDEWKIEGKIYKNFIGLGVPVDLILKTPESVDKSLKRVVSITKEAMKEGIIIYE